MVTVATDNDSQARYSSQEEVEAKAKMQHIGVRSIEQGRTQIETERPSAL